MVKFVPEATVAEFSNTPPLFIITVYPVPVVTKASAVIVFVVGSNKTIVSPELGVIVRDTTVTAVLGKVTV